jgi:hypothetical protein
LGLQASDRHSAAPRIQRVFGAALTSAICQLQTYPTSTQTTGIATARQLDLPIARPARRQDTVPGDAVQRFFLGPSLAQWVS